MGFKNAILVGVYEHDSVDAQESIEELAFLSKTARLSVKDKILQRKQELDPAYYIGQGKLHEIFSLIKQYDIDVVIFDNELKPLQVRNLEKRLECPVIDRTELILEIFALRARTKQAKLQVESAKLKYTLPRLRGLWTHLTRIEGGIGTRGGEGEKQIELDKRMIKRKIQTIDKKLKDVEKIFDTERKGREDCYKVSLVGYTNTGKSTLLNKMAGAHVFAENKLFATLDPTTKRVDLGNNNFFLLTDTVGFIKKLPHHLVASFHATLAEILYADLILHIIDASHPKYKEQITVVEDTLKQIGHKEKNIVQVFNKIDLVENKKDFNGLKVSALTGEGVDKLKLYINSLIISNKHRIELEVDAGNGKLLAYIRAHTNIIDEELRGNTYVFSVFATEREIEDMKQLKIKNYKL